MTAAREAVTVRVFPAAGKWAATVKRAHKPYGHRREFDTLPAALVHCAQMLRVLADEGEGE